MIVIHISKFKDENEAQLKRNFFGQNLMMKMQNGAQLEML